MGRKLLYTGLAGLLAFVGCDDGSGGGTAQVRVIHLSPDAPPVDVFVDGSAAFSNVAYKGGTAYASVAAGSHDLAVRAAGMPTSTPVLTANGVSFAADSASTVVAYDSLADITPLVLTDDADGIPSGQIRIRVVHTATGIGTVDVWNLPASGAPTKIVDDLAFGKASDFLDLPAGAYTVGIDANQDAVPDLEFTTPALAAGTYANVFAVADDDGAHLVAQLGDGTTATLDPLEAKLRVAHLSPNAPAVDVWADTGASPAFTNLPFGSGTAYASLPSGKHDFFVRASPSTAASANVLAVNDLDLAAGASYTAVAYGLLGDAATPIAALAVRDDASGLASGNIRVNVVHTAAGIGQVDVWNVTSGTTPAPLVQDLDYGKAAAPLDVPAQAYAVGIDTNNDGTPELVFDVPALPAGSVANVFAVKNGASVYLEAQLATTTGTLVKLSPRP